MVNTKFVQQIGFLKKLHRNLFTRKIKESLALFSKNDVFTLVTRVFLNTFQVLNFYKKYASTGYVQLY